MKVTGLLAVVTDNASVPLSVFSSTKLIFGSCPTPINVSWIVNTYYKMKTKTGYSYGLLTSVRSVIVIPTIVTSNLSVSAVDEGADMYTIPSCLINGK